MSELDTQSELQVVELVGQVCRWLLVDRLSHQEGKLVGILARGRHADSALGMGGERNTTSYTKFSYIQGGEMHKDNLKISLLYNRAH